MPTLEALEDRQLLAAFGTEYQRFADDPMPLAQFGSSVAISGDLAIIGAPHDSEHGKDAGAAYIFSLKSSKPDEFENWVQLEKLTASDAAPGDHFGSSVAIDINPRTGTTTIVVGSPADDVAGMSSGQVYVFTPGAGGNGAWKEAKLRASDGGRGHFFGASVSVDEDRIVVGAPFSKHRGVTTGAAYLFEGEGIRWRQVQKLTAYDADFVDEFGTSVAIADDTVVISAPRDDDAGRDSGSVYIYSCGTSSRVACKDPRKISGAATSDSFGYAVTADAKTIVVGAYLHDVAGRGALRDAGAAYVYERGLDRPDTWGLAATLVASEPQAGGHFGRSVSIDDNRIIVGAPNEDGAAESSGSAYLFQRAPGLFQRARSNSTEWDLIGGYPLGPGQHDAAFGGSVAVTPKAALVGAPRYDNSQDTGVAYFYVDPPTLRMDGLSVDEGHEATITGDHLKMEDPDDGPDALIYRLLTLPRRGMLYLDGVPLEVESTFTQANINNGLVSYEHDGTETEADSFTFAAYDAGGLFIDGGSAEFPITINPVNDPPELTVPSDRQIGDEDTPLVIVGTVVADPDVADGLLEVTLSTDPHLTVGSTASLAQTDGLAFFEGDGVADSRMRFRAPIDEINRALRAITFHGGVNYSGGDTLNISISDLGYTGAGGPMIDEDSIGIHMNPVNDAPVLTLPSERPSGSEYDEIEISGIQAEDVDVGVGQFEVDLFVTYGRLSLDRTDGLRFTIGDGIQDRAMRFFGGINDVNAAVARITYQRYAPEGIVATAFAAETLLGAVRQAQSNEPGDTLFIRVDDQGNTGSGGPMNDSGAVDIEIVSFNDPPTLLLPDAQSVDEDTNLVIAGIRADDMDVGNGRLQVSLEADGAITLFTTDGLEFAEGDGTQDASMTFLGGLENVNTALNVVTYRGNEDDFGTGALRITVDDQGNTGIGGTMSVDGAIAIEVLPINDAPSFTAGPDQSVNEDAGPQSVADWARGLAAGPANESGQNLQFVVVTNDNPDLFQAGPSIDSSGTLSYTPAPNGHGTALITVALQDSGGTERGGVNRSPAQPLSIEVIPVNDRPQLSVPGRQTVHEDADLLIPRIRVEDLDVGTGLLEVALSVSNGSITLPQTDGLEFTQGDGAQDAAMTFLGSLESINAALDIITYRGNQDFFGTETLAIAVNDQGNTGSGGLMSTEAEVVIDVLPVNDAPRFIVGPDQTVNEDAGPQSVVGWAGDVSSGPANESGQNLQFVIISNDNTNLFEAGPSVDSLGTLNYLPALGVFGTANITVALQDDGGTDRGGVDRSVPRRFSIQVGAVNDPPQLRVPEPQRVHEDADLLIPRIRVEDLDVGTGLLEVALSVSNGSITLPQTDGLEFTQGDGAQDAAMTFLGSLESINAALDIITYRGNQDFFGTESLAIAVNDQGNTGSGGLMSTEAEVVIDVLSVNDAPSFTAGPNQRVNEDAGPQSVVGWAKDVSAGPANESEQDLQFVIISNDNPDLFAIAPLVNSLGTLTYVPAGIPGNANITVALMDDGGTDRGGVDRSAPQRVKIQFDPMIPECPPRYYAPPAEGWTYEFLGDSVVDRDGFEALDGTWSHSNRADSWDGTRIGEGSPGGVSALSGGCDFVRFQDTGDPRDYGFGGPSNWRLYFGHNITDEGADGNILDDGVTLAFRARIATTSPLDNAHPDGGLGVEPWPADGDGYVIHEGGRGNFTVHQESGGTISFSLALPDDDADRQNSVLLMNNLNGSSISPDVDTGDGGLRNELGLVDARDWSEFWITIREGGDGTHRVEVFANGEGPFGFDVTAGNRNDFADISYIAMGAGSTAQAGAIDVDYFAWAAGVIDPIVGFQLPPQITSDDVVLVFENTLPVLAVQAVDPNGDTLIHTIVGGADAAQFAIDPVSGELAFVSAPDFDVPSDADGDNNYDVWIGVDDGRGGISFQNIIVTVDEAFGALSPGVGNAIALNNPADVNRDGIFDRLDIVRVLQGDKFGTGEPATWEQGDWNLDGVFNRFDILAVLQQGHEYRSPEPGRAGDANQDGRFDQLDIVQLLQTAKYLTGTLATWTEGDWNGDDVFNQLDIVLVLTEGHYFDPGLTALSPVETDATRSLAEGDANGPSFPNADVALADEAFWLK